MVIEKDESRRIRSEIRAVLLRVWDPIGIVGEQNAQDEYDGYVVAIYQLLINGSTDKEINDHLYRIVRVQMSLNPTNASMEPTVEALRAIPLSTAQAHRT